jgi:hypothetical protein
MKKKLIALLFVCGWAALITGCVSTLDGTSKVGNPLGKDTIESRYERPTDQIFQAAKQVLAHMGTLTGENTISKTLQAKVNKSTVWVKVDEVDPKVSRVMVQARGGGADIATASEVDKRIALQLK